MLAGWRGGIRIGRTLVLQVLLPMAMVEWSMTDVVLLTAGFDASGI
jgi:hypothetical protein